MRHIELFAGCGGLSLGLKAAGFKNIMANEISPMASETYAYNLHNESLATAIPSNKSSTFWLSSNYSRLDMKLRLREDPRTTLPYDDKKAICDIDEITSLSDKLIVGSVIELNRIISERPELIGTISSPDLVSGGPPCQGFSMAGLREISNERNTLPWEFIKFVSVLSPKIALLENVSGILKPFNKNSTPYHAWYEICKGFRDIGYVPLCLHLNAQFVGVPQHRKRFILIAFHNDFYNELVGKLNKSELKLLQPSVSFYQNKDDTAFSETSLLVNDLTIECDNLIKNTFLSPLKRENVPKYSVKDAIGDLSNKTHDKSEYSLFLNKKLGVDLKDVGDIANNENRNNSALVKRRFRIYQVLSLVDKRTNKEVKMLLNGTSDVISTQSLKELSLFKFLLNNGDFDFITNSDHLHDFLKAHLTKKNSQKALIANEPSPSALSIPDDFCHYSENQLRTLTVREMARIQSFPDNFIFKSKITTGGKNRKYEVPQYTQVGNAIPPLLGFELGCILRDLIQRI